MDFIDQVKQFAKRIESMRESIATEEATKTAIVMPFFAMLGYDVFNPQEFVPEYTADVGIKKNEKVDYAIIRDGQPAVLIECKSVTEKLERHDSQLFRYFGTTSAKFAILTNGIIYKFFTDTENPNKMDSDPFLTINMLDIKDNQVPELKKFCKASFDIETIMSIASELKYVNEFKATFSAELENPSDELLRIFLQSSHQGMKTQAVLDRFRPILKKSLMEYISELMSDKLKNALGGNISIPDAPQDVERHEEEKQSNIVTTMEEIEAYAIVKSLLSDTVSPLDITYKDTESYMGVLYKANTRKWICRFKLTDNVKVLTLPTEDKKEVRYQLSNIYDIKLYKEQLEEVVKRYL